MKNKSKKLITITPIRRATEDEKKTLVKWTIGISHFPEMDGKARAFFPTHSFEIIRKHRESVYEILLQEFSRERATKVLKTTEDDYKYFHKSWLNNELKEIDRIGNIPGTTRNELIQLEMYRDYINDELNKSTNKKAEGLTGRELALITVYKKEKIARNKGKIYQHFKFYNNDKNMTRVNIQINSAKQAINHIKRVEKIIPYLPQSNQQTAKDHLKAFIINAKSEFGNDFLEK